jgi:hypothetical protein
MRTSRTLLSVFEISEEDYKNLDKYIAVLNSNFKIDVATRLSYLRKTIFDLNSNGYFEAEGMQPARVRMIDRARLILNRFAKNGTLKRLLENADEVEDDLTSAFVLGCLATENHWLEIHEDAVFEGYAHMEGREAGRPLARAARLRQGKKTRRAVLAAAAAVYEKDPSLRRNDSRAASRILSMKPDALRKTDGTYLGADAIIKHLRAARKAGAESR